MAKVKKTKAGKGSSKKVKGGNKAKKKSFKSLMFTFLSLLMAVVFLPTTFLLMIALLPSFVAAFVDRAKRKTRAVTVGAMNLAGTTPFLLTLWQKENSFDQAFDIVTDPKAIIAIYSFAVVGYLIDWAMTGIVSGFLLQRGKSRVKAIEKRQKQLVDRWGKEVTGEVEVDQYGFAIEKDE